MKFLTHGQYLILILGQLIVIHIHKQGCVYKHLKQKVFIIVKHAQLDSLEQN